MTSDEVQRFFDAYGPMVLRRARTLLGDKDAAKDILQEVFMKAMSDNVEVEVSAQAASWLYRVTTNLCLNQIRNTGRRRELIKQHMSSSEPSEDGLDTAQTARRLLAEADQQWSHAAVLVHVDGMSYQEASDVLGVSTRTISNFLTRFRTFALERMGGTG